MWRVHSPREEGNQGFVAGVEVKRSGRHSSEIDYIIDIFLRVRVEGGRKIGQEEGWRRYGIQELYFSCHKQPKVINVRR